MDRASLTNGVAFTRRLRHLSFQPPFERISDPQIPLTRHNSERMVENLEAIVAVATLKDFR